MALKPIITPSDAVLRKKAHKVTSFDKKFQKLVDDMIETMLDAPGVGLAAPQVAVSQRLIVVQLQDDEESRAEYGDDAGVLYVLANPEIVKASDELVEGVEACLSIPGYFGKVERHEKVTIKALDRDGKPTRVKASGWLARVFQHEIDHLDGKLYIDIASDIWKARPQPVDGDVEIDSDSDDEDEDGDIVSAEEVNAAMNSQTSQD
ncbi:MAG: peptide deformylase [Burkholderiales bacterium]|nr:peptide deformylase [Anaerolineae bacterium]